MKQHLESLIQIALQKLISLGELPEGIQFTIHIEHARDKQYGDFASNIAMILAKVCKSKPRDLAAKIVEHLPKSDVVAKVDIAGPGFINFSLTAHAYEKIIPDILDGAENYGRKTLGSNKRVNVEFISANPTGPLHVGHGRSAAFGSSLSNLLQTAGFDVHSEYYVNDAGRQMNILAVSVWLRYLELLGENIKFPTNGYKGEYVKAIAAAIKENDKDRFRKPITEIFKDVSPDLNDEGVGDKEAHVDGLIQNAKRLLGDDYPVIFNYGLNTILDDIKDDLHEFGVDINTWFSEKSLDDEGTVKEAIEKLRQNGYLYERDGATWFSSIPLGDDKDRVVIRENGQTTYFASDLAYLLNKFKRGYDECIYIFGADHHGYIARLKAAAKALGLDPEKVRVLLVQFAILYRGKEKVQMSTRSGSFVTLRELREEVGNDAARFFYVLRKCEQHMDFDLELAKSQTADNPVYYIQYAYARVASVFRQLADKKLEFDPATALQYLHLLTEEHERTLMLNLARYEEMVELAASAYEPHQIAIYLRDLANDFHSYYNAHHFIVDNAQLCQARLALIKACQHVFKNGLTLLGVAAPQEM